MLLPAGLACNASARAHAVWVVSFAASIAVPHVRWQTDARPTTAHTPLIVPSGAAGLVGWVIDDTNFKDET